MIDFSQFDSLIAMIMYFNNEATCRHTLTNLCTVGTQEKISETERFTHMFDKSIGLVKKWSEIRFGLMTV